MTYNVFGGTLNYLATTKLLPFIL